MNGQWEHQHVVRCQVCGVQMTYAAGHAPDLAAAKQAAHERGWQMRSGHWVCGGCARARQERKVGRRG